MRNTEFRTDMEGDFFSNTDFLKDIDFIEELDYLEEFNRSVEDELRNLDQKLTDYEAVKRNQEEILKRRRKKKQYALISGGTAVLAITLIIATVRESFGAQTTSLAFYEGESDKLLEKIPTTYEIIKKQMMLKEIAEHTASIQKEEYDKKTEPVVKPNKESLEIPVIESPEVTENDRPPEDESKEIAKVDEPKETSKVNQEKEVPTVNPEKETPAVNQPKEDAPDKNSKQSEEEFFKNTAFIGNSRTVGLQLMCGLNSPTFLAAKSLTVSSAMEKRVIGSGRHKKTVLESLKENSFDRIYIAFGINELGWPNEDAFYDRYKNLIVEIQKLQPNAVLYIQSIIPVTSERSKRDKVFNNNRIDNYNKLIKRLCDEYNCNYLNVADKMSGEDGALPKEASSDGIHLTKKYCKLWLQYIRELSE